MKQYIVPFALVVWHILVLFGGGVFFHNFGGVDYFGVAKMLPACIFAGLVGGIIYCLRGIYLHFCVRKDWDDVWIVWHAIRPMVSTLCGGVSYFFLKSGLLLLNDGGANTSPYIYYVLAFLAGYNVDKFLKKAEEINKSTTGTDKSNASK